MSKRSDDDKSKWDQMMESVDLLFDRISDINNSQPELKQQVMETTQKVDRFSTEQDFISQQVKANGQAVARLTLKNFEKEEQFLSDDAMSEFFEDDEAEDFDNVFANGKKPAKASVFKPHRHNNDPPPKNSLPHQSLPKMQFPTFDGQHPTIWFDNCDNYFTIYSIPETLWVTAAAMHLKDNAAKWWQAYKQTHRRLTWKAFCEAVHMEFRSDDYRSAVAELLTLKQSGTVEDYTTQFQSLQFQVSMTGSQVDEQFFATTYVHGLKEDIRAGVEPHTPTTVRQAAIIAKIQQRNVERTKLKYQRPNNPPKNQYQKPDNRQPTTYGNLWRDKQLRDYRKANNLCYFCGKKFEPGHAEVCTKRTRPM